MSTDSRRRNLKQGKVILFLILILATFAYIFSNGLLRLIVLLFVSVGAFSYIFYKLVIFATSFKGTKFNYIWSELIYSSLGIPVLIISAFYLPISMYIVFTKSAEMTIVVKYVLLTMMFALQAISLLMFILRYVKDRKGKTDDIFELEFNSSNNHDVVFSPEK